MADTAIVRRYRTERAKGTPAATAMSIARYEHREPRYAFLTDLGMDKPTEDEIGPFTVTVKVVPDDQARLGDDDVTGWFTDEYEDGCVTNERRNWGNDCKYYRPSNYTVENAYDDFRKAGMSKSVARDAVRERIEQEMYEDANRQYYGVVVTVSIGGRELAQDSLWGIDDIPGYNVEPYLVEVSEGLIDGALSGARERLPALIDENAAEASALRAALEEVNGG